MKSRRSLLVLGIVIALMLSAVAVASAHAAKSKAKFDADALVFGVGPGGFFDPGAEFSTKVKVKFKGRGANRHIDRIVVKTKDEGVMGGSTAVQSCVDSGEPGACGATGVLLNGQTILSLHSSRAVLTNVVVIPPAEFGFEAYQGNLEGKLKGDFFIGDIAGTAKLDIDGEAIYACFNSLLEPEANIGACTRGGDDFDSTNVFVPALMLDVVDTGTFKIKVKPGEVTVGDLELKKMSGKLKVTVDAELGDDPPLGTIQIIDAKAVFFDSSHVHGDDD